MPAAFRSASFGTINVNERRKTMGLDMHAVATSWEVPDLEHFDTNEYTELHYWRKHPNLHGWMEALYYAKGGTVKPFNVGLLRPTPRKGQYYALLMR
jgi:hypothetical protein